MKKLSKSKYMAGLQCSKRLWMQVHDPLPADERETSSAAEWGTYVGEKARALFPEGLLIPAQEIGVTKAVAQTEAALADKTIPAIFEATFLFEDVQVRVDILERTRGGWILNEVKGTTRLKDEHIPDIAVQLYVLRGARLTVRKANVVYIDNSYIRGKKLNVEKLFSRQDVTDEAEEYLGEVPGKLAEFKALLKRRTAPTVEPWSYCSTPYDCEFIERCTAKKPGDWILHLRGRWSKALEALIEKRKIERISHLPADAPLSAEQATVRDVLKSGKPFVSPRLKDALKDTRDGVLYLDFETANPAIPAFDGTRPFQAFPFQWSLHAGRPGGKLTHRMFLADHKSDPRLEFARSLVDALDEFPGPILVYSPAERTIIDSLRRELPPKLGKRLDPIRDRLFDLHKIVKQHVYLADFNNSFSLKQVAPALDPSIDYAKLDGIAEGQGASDAFAAMCLGEIDDPNEIVSLRRQLEAYCTLDTLALAKVHTALLRLQPSTTG
jgi:hypothetical protein